MTLYSIAGSKKKGKLHHRDYSQTKNKILSILSQMEKSEYYPWFGKMPKEGLPLTLDENEEETRADQTPLKNEAVHKRFLIGKNRVGLEGVDDELAGGRGFCLVNQIGLGNISSLNTRDADLQFPA